MLHRNPTREIRFTLQPGRESELTDVVDQNGNPTTPWTIGPMIDPQG